MMRLLSVVTKRLALWGCAVVLFPACALAGAGFETKAPYAYMIDYATGTVLLDKSADVAMGPSSMTKLMTAYLVFDALKQGRITLNTKFPVSVNAWRKGGSRMFVAEGSEVAVGDLIQGMIVQSGNDACIVLAEGLSGTEESFVNNMNLVGKKIGLTQSHFKNTNGWPDEGHLMSAKDLVTLAVRLYEDFPEYMHYYSQKEYTYNGIKQINRNKLLHRNLGVDGFKTGYTEDNGYGITVTAEQNGRRVFLTINGLENPKERIAEAEKLVIHGLHDYGFVNLYKKGDVVTEADVWLGNQQKVPLVLDKEVGFLKYNRQAEQPEFQVQVRYEGPVSAPIAKDDTLGELVVLKDGKEFKTYPLKAGVSVDKASFVQSLVSRAKYYFVGSI